MTPTRVVLRAVLCAACSMLGVAPLVSAHGPLHEQIAALTLRIERQPRDAFLYLRRGDLHAQDGDTRAALSDYDRAAWLDPAEVEVDLARGRTLSAAGRFAEAKAALDRYLDQRPDDPDARTERARTLSKLGRPDAAVGDYTRAIREREARGRVVADDYLERAQALVKAGGHRSEALRGLDEGIARLGPLASLELYALDLELASARYDEALAPASGGRTVATAGALARAPSRDPRASGARRRSPNRLRPGARDPRRPALPAT